MLQKMYIAVLLLCLSTLALAQQATLSVAQKYATFINEQALEKHLRIVAADSMEGRNTGQKGQKKAAEYIQKHFQNIGLAPVEVPNLGKSYLQPFQLVERKWETAEASIKIGEKKTNFGKDFFMKDSFLKDRYALGNAGINQETIFETLYAGFGIEAEGYSDFTKIETEVKDKLLLMFEDEPKNTKGESIAQGELKTKDTEKFALAKSKGAKGVIIITENFAQAFEEHKYKLEKGSNGLKAQEPTEMPIFYVNMTTAANILGIPLKDLIKLKTEISRRKATNAGLKGKNISLKAPRVDNVKISSENVLGFLEGTDKKDEIVVITAHYDHVGMGKEGVVFNGADDDGSGTVSVMQIAEAFCQAYKEGIKPRRSILFMTVAGEEIGLFGSRFYTDLQPLFPLENTVVDLNIDMIGRVDEKYENLKNPNYIYLIGSDKLSTQLHELSEEVNQKTEKIVLDYTYNDENEPNRFYYRSDHYNFAKNNIPIIFYFNGTHPDYHKPTDDVDKIHFPKMAKIAKLIFYTAWEIAHRQERLIVDKQKK